MPTKIQSAIRITLTYAIFGSLWILFSDSVVNALVSDPAVMSQIQTFKGWLFILVTTGLLHWLVLSSLHSFEEQNELDPLTHLLRHYLFKQRLSAMLLRPRPNQSLMLIYIDIDAFSDINGQFSYETGDQVLVATASRLMNFYSSDVIIGRVGADQFAVAFWTPQSPDNIDTQIHNLRQQLQEVETGLKAPLSHTFGIALAPEDGETSKRLMSSCAEALGRAKKRQRGSVEFHNQALSDKEKGRRSLLTDLRLALQQNTMSIVYQPQFALHGRALTGVEVLVRWEHPELGMVPPDVFIPIAEDYGLSAQITAQVFRMAAEELVGSGLLGNQIPRASINISAVEFNSPPLFAGLQQTIEQYPKLVNHLQIEITETATLANLQHSAAIIQRLHDTGIRFSIDDFGTGYTSLRMLKDLPINEIKIDRSFITDMMHEPKVAAIVNAIISMARSFDLTIVAEGIENQSQIDKLAEMQCNELQGYHLARPMPLKQLQSFISSRA